MEFVNSQINVVVDKKMEYKSQYSCYLLFYILLLNYNLVLLSNFEHVNIKVVSGRKHDEKRGSADFVDLQMKINESSRTVLFETRSIDNPYLAWGLFFNKGLQVIKHILVGEADLKEIPYDSVCFINTMNRKEIVDIESMKRISEIAMEPQKAEVTLDKQYINVNLKLLANEFKYFDAEINRLCSRVQHIYTTAETINHLAAGDKVLKTKMLSLTKPQPTRNDSSYPLCKEAVSLWDVGCSCERQLCMPWYPCGLKYCPIQGKNQKAVCGLLTCEKCTEYSYYVERKDLCFWDISNN